MERFQDYMVKDKETGECFRADHFIKQMAQKMLDDKETPENVRKDLDSILAKVFNYLSIKL